MLSAMRPEYNPGTGLITEHPPSEKISIGVSAQLSNPYLQSAG